MSVNFGSQQLPLTDVNYTDETIHQGSTPVSVNVDSLLSTNEEPAQMEPLLNVQTAMTFNLGFQQLSTNEQLVQVEPSPKIQTATSANLGSQQLSSKNKQSVQVELSPKAHTALSGKLALHQLPSTYKESVHMELTPKVQPLMHANLGLPQLLSTNKQPPQMEPLTKVHTATPINLGSQQLSSKNKRMAQMGKSPKVQSINLGHQLVSSTNKRTANVEPSPNIRTESFEDVRSKLRDSLAASLALDSEEQSKSQAVGKISSNEAASTSRQLDAGNQKCESSSITMSALSCHMSGKSLDTLSSKSNEHDIIQKPDDGQSLASNVFTNDNSSCYTQMWKCDVQEFQLKHASVEDDMLSSHNFVIKDDLLQENGLCWVSDMDVESVEAKENRDSKRPKLSHEEVTRDVWEPADKRGDTLATKIEAELYRLYGGVNKKYKEKGRSLLFNLKDRNNPELRKRVLSGEIAPERLCSMTAEELASKQLSEWRIAKAEELAQMVVLPDSEVDFRRLVKKTHKGEFRVEVERDDNFSLEVALGANSLSQVPTRASETKTHLKSNEIEASEGPILHEKVDSEGQNLSNNLTTLPHEKTDFMQEFMADELKDAEFLPPIVSLDEFMEALDSEPPFENLSMGTERDTPTPDGKKSESSKTKLDSVPDSSDYKLDPAPDSLESKSDLVLDRLDLKSDHASDNVVPKLAHVDVGSTDLLDSAVGADKLDSKNTMTDKNLKPFDDHTELDSCPPDIASSGEHVWEGLIQFNISSLVTVVGVFKSGKKTSTKDWPSFLEIKGRVRLDAFEKFLQELTLSRRRAIMVVHFQLKEGSPESGRPNLREAVDSYVADERVGYAEPAPGVELYFCPPYTKTTQILGRHLPKENTETLTSTVNGLIGVIVWRRAHVSSTISPRQSSQHKHTSSKMQFISRKQQNSNANFTSKTSAPTLPVAPPPPSKPVPQLEEEDIDDDVPPGFGPVAARDEDDLPEFDFVQVSSRHLASNPTPSHVRPAHQVEQMRELIHKYGQGGTRNNFEPWNSDDDDIPEWHPHEDNQPQPPPPPPPQHLHGFQRQIPLPHLVVNQHLAATQLPPSPRQLMPLAAPLPMPLPPQMSVTQVSHNVHPSWQQQQQQLQLPGAWWPPARGPADAGSTANGSVRPSHFGGPWVEGGLYDRTPGFGNTSEMDWRSDNPRSRGV